MNHHPHPPTLPAVDSFNHRAARFSLVALLSALVLGFALDQVFSRQLISLEPEVRRPLAIGVATVVVCILASGAIAGIIALCGIARHGTRGLLLKGVTGTVLCTLTGFVYVTNFNSARDRAQSRADLHEAMTNLLGTTEAEIDDLDAIASRLENSQSALDRAAANASGPEAAAMRASSAYMAIIRKATEDFTVKAQALQAAAVLDPSTLEKREDLADRTRIVTEFLNGNLAFTEIIRSGEALFTAELDKQKPDEKMREAVLTGFKNAFSRSQPLSLKIREADTQLANDFLAVLKLLDTEWGNWEYDEDAEQINFEEDAASEAYTALLTRIGTVAEEQTAAQLRLIEVQRSLQPGR